VRLMKAIYCKEGYAQWVERELTELMDRMQEEHPEWEFDMELDWDGCPEGEEK